MNSGIYKITNTVNGKFYVGQTMNGFDTRWNPLKNNTHHNKHLQAAYNKYGEEAFTFEVILHCPPERETLNFWEELFLRDHWNKDYCYNLREGGGNRGRHTETTKRKLSEVASKRTGKKNPMYGKTHSEEARRKISEAVKKRPNPMLGRTHSEESKRKMSEGASKKTGAENPKASPVKVKLSNGEEHIFHTVKQASNYFGVTRYTIHNALVKGGWSKHPNVKEVLRGATIEYV